MKKFLIIFGLVFICPLKPLYAEEKIPMPDGIDYEVDGVQGIFFTLEEYKQIARIYNQYISNLDKIKFINTKYELMLDIEKSYELRIDNCKEHIKIMEYDTEFWRARHKEMKNDIKLLNKSNKLKSIFYWSAISLLLVTNIVSVTHDATD